MDGILLIDKPIGMTSHDVVNIVRKVYQTKKVGHTGTLDPDASGLLVIGINKGTKIIQYLNSDDKHYQATICFGIATETLDRTGEIINKQSVTSLPDLDEIIDRFNGLYEQTPPMYSAIKYNGKRLYEYARQGITIDDIPSRMIEIEHIQRTSDVTYKDDCAFVDYEVHGSKGLYVRTLSYDIGKAIGVPAHNYALRRIQAGHFHLRDAYTLEEVKAHQATVLSLHHALVDMPYVVANEEMLLELKHGRPLPVDLFKEKTITKIIDQNEQLLAIYEYNESQNLMKAKQVFYKE